MHRWITTCLAAACAMGSLAAHADATAKLHALFDREWQRGLQEDPEGASYLGNARYNDRWPDRSLDAIATSHAADQTALKTLAALDAPAGDRLFQGRRAESGTRHQ